MPRRNTRGMSLTLRSSALKIGGEGLRQGGINSGNLKGLGLGIQLALDKHWGIELSADHLSMGSDRATLTVMPMTVGLISRLFPESRFSIYAINGLSAVHTNIARASGPEENFTQFGVQFILGAEFRLNEHLHLSADARGLVLRSRPSTEQDDQKTTEQGLTQDRPPPNQERQLRSGLQSGVQFTAGIGYRW
jgi:hypothetical protein